MKTVHPDNCIFKYYALQKSLQCNVYIKMILEKQASIFLDR